ncbi:Acetate kinase [Picochlorum sp. SENEW3]|nr:Acetate kinase [Picochlorum sp. SENEW3]
MASSAGQNTSKILTLNAGSSSLKFKIYEFVSQSLNPLAWGVCERVGEPKESTFKAFCRDGSEDGGQRPFGDHAAALDAVSDYLQGKFSKSIAWEVAGVGHRVVHGKTISDPLMVTADVKKLIQDASDLAPLHNPANVKGIDAAEKTFPKAVQVAVFDTAFHQTMPPEAYTYALPKEICDSYHLRKYGFHGTSYKYLCGRAAAMVGKSVENFNGIMCHLGAGASVCVVQNGKSIDTTMGLTPLQGLMMATRCGDVDPSIVAFLDSKGIDAQHVEVMMNKKSGFLGLTGQTDIREVHKKADAGDEDACLALKLFARRVKNYIGAYMFQLNGDLDAIVFTAGIGEHDSAMRTMICDSMGWAGVVLDTDLNASKEATSGENSVAIHHSTSKVSILVMPTDEEGSIAEQTLAVMKQEHCAM